jgi:hypothetical protein
LSNEALRSSRGISFIRKSIIRRFDHNIIEFSDSFHAIFYIHHPEAEAQLPRHEAFVLTVCCVRNESLKEFRRFGPITINKVGITRFNLENQHNLLLILYAFNTLKFIKFVKRSSIILSKIISFSYLLIAFNRQWDFALATSHSARDKADSRGIVIPIGKHPLQNLIRRTILEKSKSKRMS